jgi:transposase
MMRKIALRASIQALAKAGMTNKKIAARLGCCESTVKKWKARHDVCDVQRIGRPPSLSPPDKEKIEDIMRDVWGSSLRSTASILNGSAAFRVQEKSVSIWTVRNYLRTTTWGKVAYRGTVKPFLSAKNIQDRLNFCNMVWREGYCEDNEEGHTRLEHVLFTDEAPISLTPLPNRQNHRIRTSSIEQRTIQKHKKSLSIMVAGGMSARGLTELHIVDHRSMVNGEYYHSKIVPNYTAASRQYNADSIFTNDDMITFQQDGAPAHTALATMRLLQGEFRKVWGKGVWPGNSPDLNPIEHIWAVLQECVFEEPRPSCRQELITRVQEKWASIRSSTLPRTLVYSFPKRIVECLNKDGKHTSY